MLVFFSYAITIRVAMIGSKVERINPTRAAMNEDVRQSPRKIIVAAYQEKRIASLRFNIYPKQ